MELGFRSRIAQCPRRGRVNPVLGHGRVQATPHVKACPLAKQAIRTSGIGNSWPGSVGERHVCSAYSPSAASAKPTSSSSRTEKYRFRTKIGSLVNVAVSHEGERCKVSVAYIPGPGVKYRPMSTIQALEYIPDPKEQLAKKYMLHWNAFRGSTDKSYHPKEAVPAGSTLHEASGGMRSPLTWNPIIEAWCTEMTIPVKLLPLHMSFAFVDAESGDYDNPQHGLSCTVPLGMSAGNGKTLGASLASTRIGSAGEQRMDVNFSVYSRDASSMTLCLVRFDAESSKTGPAKGLTYMEVALDPRTNRTGDLWHICVHSLKELTTLSYAWKADGDVIWSGGGKFHGGYLLLDPHAIQAVSVVMPEKYWSVANKLPPSPKHDRPVMLGCLAPLVPSTKPPPTSMATSNPGGRVMVEVDAKSFATGPEVAPEHQGKLLGIIDRMPLFLDIGATTVLLSPITLATNEGECLSLFAIDPALAVGGAITVADELNQLVSALHAAGIEVLLELEFCTTGEGLNATGHSGLQGMHGLAPDVYYRKTPTGLSILNVGHPVVRQLVLDSLHHWSSKFGIDGFCFLKAENLCQDRSGYIQDCPPLAEEIAHDPILSHLQLLASPSDTSLLPRNGERGFPHWGIWAQSNVQFESIMRSYLGENNHGLMSQLATIITGSPNLLSANWDGGLPGCLATGRPPYYAINIVSPMGATKSLPSYLLGSHDAPSGDATKWNEVLARTLLLSMYASSGVPCFNASTVASDPSLRRFVGMLGVVRCSLMDLLSPPKHDSPRLLHWHGVRSEAQPDWQGVSNEVHGNCMAFSVRGVNGRAVYVAFNPYKEQVAMVLPIPPTGMGWKVVINTGAKPPADAALPSDEGLPALSNASYSNQRQQVVMAPTSGVLIMAVARPASQLNTSSAAANTTGAPSPPQSPSSDSSWKPYPAAEK